jgi:hypothetical protein
MEKATRDKQSSTSEPKKQQKTHGWIRMHSDEKMKPPDVDESLDTEAQSHDRKTRKELEKR